MSNAAHSLRAIHLFTGHYTLLVQEYACYLLKLFYVVLRLFVLLVKGKPPPNNSFVPIKSFPYLFWGSLAWCKENWNIISAKSPYLVSLNLLNENNKLKYLTSIHACPYAHINSFTMQWCSIDKNGILTFSSIDP